MVGSTLRRSSLGSLVLGGVVVALTCRYFTPAEQDLAFAGGTVNLPTARHSKVACQGVDKKMKDRITSV
eukprot:CAMPEP_0183545572 /NCGR_PEP_ID=MMETSP0371-20130417/51678_1 /TAXON_ID=268820 /ORGANISM="Peridinium aciculiferum, Strain PAER-2" /LENGTH=68 /DNA_ID=CAMNT_0025747789 /DNA_START=51 /DNA_END=253 /DNA_ORIENTATION=-